MHCVVDKIPENIKAITLVQPIKDAKSCVSTVFAFVSPNSFPIFLTNVFHCFQIFIQLSLLPWIPGMVPIIHIIICTSTFWIDSTFGIRKYNVKMKVRTLLLQKYGKLFVLFLFYLEKVRSPGNDFLPIVG